MTTTTTVCDHAIRPMVEGRSAHAVMRCRCGLRRVQPASVEENAAYAEGMRLTARLCETRLTTPEDQELLGDLLRAARREWQLKITRELSAGLRR